jgi:hypothetical protein
MIYLCIVYGEYDAICIDNIDNIEIYEIYRIT